MTSPRLIFALNDIEEGLAAVHGLVLKAYAEAGLPAPLAGTTRARAMLDEVGALLSTARQQVRTLKDIQSTIGQHRRRQR